MGDEVKRELMEKQGKDISISLKSFFLFIAGLLSHALLCLLVPISNNPIFPPALLH